jgi:hypothetical protein
MKHLDFTFIISSMMAALTVSVGGHAARTVPDPWPDEAYRVKWEEPHIPAEAPPKTRIAIPVTLRNNGNRVWPESQVFVAYHWLRDGRLVVWDGERTPFPHDLRAGSRAALSVRVTTPTEPGSYVLMLTLVHEHVTWFEHKGAATLVQPITVLPPTQPVDRSAFTPWTTTP